MAMKTSSTNLPKSFNDALDRLLDRHNRLRGDGSGRVCSFKAQKERAGILRHAFAQLYQDGYHLETPENLGERHIKVLAARWDREGLVAGTLHTRISVLSVFAEWIGKAGMVKAPASYFSSNRIKRRTATQVDHAWDAHGVDKDRMIAAAYALNERLGLYLELEDQFGLRVKEAIEFRPRNSIDPKWRHVTFFEGTKGGRPRVVMIETAEQRRVLEKAMAMICSNGRIRWPGRTFQQAYGRYYRLVRKLGITKKDLGVTSHGLRHEFAHDLFKFHTGLPAPIQNRESSQIDRETYRHAAAAVAEGLGHSRIQVTTAYNGSPGRLPAATQPRSPWSTAGSRNVTYRVTFGDFSALRISGVP